MHAARRPITLLVLAGLALSARSLVGGTPVMDSALAASTAPPAARPDLGNQQLPIKRITLYRSGVGAFERRGMIDGRAEIPLRFVTDQVNDILKSMFVLDKGGTVESIRYGSKDPLSKRLASFGIDISDNPNAGEILQRLRGTPAKIILADGQATGTIMNVESRPTVYPGSGPNGTVVHNLPWVNLLTKDGVRSYNLAEARGYEILDPAIAEELNKALAALAEHRADRVKTVDVTVNGTGARDVIVGYIHEMPVWKTSYRLILPDSPKGDAATKPGDSTMQGWAIVENTTDEDWNNVGLSLVSGRPVSFQMDLYEPLYVFRPQIPVPTVPGVMPRAYEGGIESFGVRMENKAGANAPAPGASPAMKESRSAGRAGASLRKSDAGEAGRERDQAYMDAAEARVPLLSASDMADYAGRSQAQGVETGEVFQFQLESPVTIERQKSAMLPILTTPIPTRRVSIYNRADARKNPMRGVEITNSSPLQLIPGPISVYDGAAYAGDAQIGHVGAGDKRLLAYAVDLDVEVLAEDTGVSEVRKIRIVDGTFEQTVKNVNSTKYTFGNKDLARARTIVLEHPKLGGWDLVEPKQPAEKTEGIYRFETTVAAAKQGVMTVTQEQVTSQRAGFADFSMDYLLEHSKHGRVSQAVLDAVREVGKRQGAINDVNAKIQRLDAEKNEISQDQGRVRENMKTVGQQAQIYAKYLQKFTEQEARIEAIDAEGKSSRADLARLQNELNEFIRRLNVE